ncbi:MAG: tetratricopeptide repeat protein [Acidobacteria bacterium]|nr:tetratricopeptide repeat protein [Acidobacteriota bacterium]
MAVLSPLVVRKPQSLTELRWRARAYAGRGEIEAALIDYRVAAAIDPDDLYSYFDLGELLGRTGRFGEAEAYLRRALELEPGRFEVREALADNSLAEGRAQFAAGRRDEARASFTAAEREARQALALNPRAIWARIDLGASLMEAERTADVPDPRRAAEATAVYEEALAALQQDGEAADPRALAAASANLCDALIQQRQLARALVVCRAAVEANPGEAAAHYNLAGVHALLGQHDAALAELERDVELGDRDTAYLAADPWFGALRSDPRFGALLARMQPP